MNESSSSPEEKSKKDSQSKLENLENKVEKLDSKVEEALKLLHEIEVRVGGPSSENDYYEAENIADQEVDSSNKKFKKVLKVIDTIAILIIIFIILDGVFNGFAWMTGITNFITNLF